MKDRHKPILLKKLALGGTDRSGEIIGILGVHRGAGVTHTGLMLAFYLGEYLDKKTAYLECNRHCDMSLIGDAYEWQDEGDNHFSYGRITCYKNVTPDLIPELLGEAYEYFLLDFGTEFAENREEFLRCTKKLVLCGSSQWSIMKLQQFVKAHESDRGNETWRYLIPFTKASKAARLKAELKRRVLAVPLLEEPTRPNRNINVFLQEILS